MNRADIRQSMKVTNRVKRKENGVIFPENYSTEINSSAI